MTRIDAGVLLAMLAAGDDVAIIDVRSPEEFEDWAIPGARNLPLETLGAHLDELPEEGEIVLVCARGARAEEAQAVLAEHHIVSSVLAGGMVAWGRTYDEVALVAGDVTIVQVRRRGKGCSATWSAPASAAS